MARILVVDDSRPVLAVAEMALKEAGYQVTTCVDGKQAIELLRHLAFDLIVTDIYMPEQDGLEVIRAIRRLCPKMSIVAMSGKTGHLNMFRVAKSLGAGRTLTKPFSKDELLEGVAAALNSVKAELLPAPKRRAG